MEKFSKIIRILTISPLMAIILCLSLYFGIHSSFNSVWMLIACIFCLSIFPTSAYVVEKKFGLYQKIDKNCTLREAERKLAICFSFISYFALTIITFLTNQPALLKEMVLTYMFSVSFILIFTMLFKINASGHMCGVVGPILFLSYSISWWLMFLLFFTIFVIYSSLKLNRHTLLELFIGAVIPTVSFVLAILII